MKKFLEEAGCIVAILAEIPTQLAMAGFPLAPDPWVGPGYFQDLMMDLGFHAEETYLELLCNLKTERPDVPRVLLIDGAIPRTMAYIGRKNYQRALEARGLDPYKVLCRYKGVIYLAPPPKEHYTTENNQARSESAEQAAWLDDPTFQAWSIHPHLQIVRATKTPEEKVKNAILALTRIIPMPKAIEREHKLLLIGFDQSMLPAGTATKELVQDYLVRLDPKVERRVRAETSDGRTVYFYTEKAKRSEPGSRDEEERQIPLSEYESKLEEKDEGLATVRKARHIFRHNDQKFEVDEFHDIKLESGQKMFIAEIETGDLSLGYTLPDGWQHLVVTENDDYKNSAIARRLKQGTSHELIPRESPAPQG